MTGEQPIVFTLKAKCRDCYRCIRVCPVKAIRMKDGQAYVEEERCIACGTCIRECPQRAKTFRNDVDRVEQMIAAGEFVAASIAPSFAAVFEPWQRERLASALRRLGFRYVGYTSQGAYQVAHATVRAMKKKPSGGYLCTACPAFVGYLQKYRSEWVPQLLSVTSPMIAHAKMIKQKQAKARVVFIGPCVAKKAEAAWPESAGAVDAVLTFSELEEWLKRKGIDLANLDASGFDEKEAPRSPFFPLPGGLIKTAGLSSDGLVTDLYEVSGHAQIQEVLNSRLRADRHILIEPLYCSQGCVNGPGIPGLRSLFDRRQQLIGYALEAGGKPEPLADETLLDTSFLKKDLLHSPHSEDAILAVLKKTGKADPDEQLNCGACGYPSCREKAQAVLDGMAEVEMCIPYMRKLAEQRMDRIMETSPNGIVILDEDLNILNMNPTFKNFFGCTEAVLGHRISRVMDPTGFEKLAAGLTEHVEHMVYYKNQGMTCHQLLYALRAEKQYAGIFVNITSFQRSETELRAVKSQIVGQARELLEHQIKMAQGIAQYLGESTAKGEELVRKLMSLDDDERASKQK